MQAGPTTCVLLLSNVNKRDLGTQEYLRGRIFKFSIGSRPDHENCISLTQKGDRMDHYLFVLFACFADAHQKCQSAKQTIFARNV